MQYFKKHFIAAIRNIMFGGKVFKQQNDLLCKRNFKNIQMSFTVNRNVQQFEIFCQFFSVFIFFINDTDPSRGNALLQSVAVPAW